jgi:Pentapeptide repeats (8 copies)
MSRRVGTGLMTLGQTNLNKALLREADLAGANLNKAFLCEADLTGANLDGADLSEADLSKADLTRANLRGANLRGVDLRIATLGKTDLQGAVLVEADLNMAHLSGADLSRADLSMASLMAASLIETDLTDADLTGCRIYGISAWGLKLEGTKQQNLLITRENEPAVTVDNLEVAQFIYLLLHNQKIRDVIDTITSKAVLILGRFTDDRKAVLDALREELRKHDYLPILFDFAVPGTRDITETVSLLARMARFIVADITDAKSIPQELAVIVPHLPSVPVQPLLLESSPEYGMFEHFKRYPWVLETYRYPSPERLIADLGERVIGPAEDYARTVKATPRGT